jgi:hypothetical protein
VTASAAFVSPQQPNPVVVPSTPSLLRVLRRPVESALAALIAVMNQALDRPAAPDGHVQGVHHQFGAQMVGHRPAHDPT